jgi:hypothetical protein
MAYSVHTFPFTKNQVRRTSLFMGPNPFPPPPLTQAPRHYTKATYSFVRPIAIFERLGEATFKYFYILNMYKFTFGLIISSRKPFSNSKNGFAAPNEVDELGKVK